MLASVYYNYNTESFIYNFQYHFMKALQKYYWVETFNTIRIKKETSQADKSNVGSTKTKLCIKYCVLN